MYLPAVLRLSCAGETCSAPCFSRRTVTAQLRFLLSTLRLDMKNNTTDRFMRDSIYGCYYAEWFFCSTTRCTTVDHSKAGIAYAECLGPGRRCLITSG